MAFAVDAQLGSAYSSPGAVSSATFTTTAAAASGTLIVVGVGVAMDTGLTISSLTGGSLTWNADVSLNNSFDNAALFSAQAASGMASSTVLTVHYSGTATGSDMAIGAMSVTGSSGATTPDKSSSRSQATTAAWTANAMSAVTAGDLEVGVSWGDGNMTAATTDTPNAGYTQSWKQTNTTGTDGATMIFKLVSAGGSVTVGGTWSAAPSAMVSVSAAYLAAGSTVSLPDLIMAPAHR